MTSSLTSLFKSGPAEEQDTDKLHELYWNRAELKKEFAALRNEKYQLQDRLKQQVGATERVQQQVNHLESLLLDREWVHNVVAFYQLRRLAAHCNAKLRRFSEELKQQREQRLQGKVQQRWEEKREAAALKLEEAVREQRLQNQLLEDQLQSERHKLTAMTGLQKIMHRKSLEKSVGEFAEAVERGQAREGELHAELKKTRDRKPPDNEGLDTQAKRSINFMILSFAQQLYLHFEEDGLADLAREASEKSVGAINYGSKVDSDKLVALLEKRWQSMENRTDSPELLQQRVKLIAEHAAFKKGGDAVPVPATVSTVFQISVNGVVSQKDVNLLGDNYFGLARVLSR